METSLDFLKYLYFLCLHEFNSVENHKFKVVFDYIFRYLCVG